MTKNLDLLAREARRLSGRKEGGRAFAVLAEAAGAVAFGIGMRVLGDEGLAGDVMQETLLKLARDLDRYDPRRPFGPWLRAIATRLAVDMYRRENRWGRASLGVVSEVPAAATDRPDRRAEASSSDRLLARLVAELPPRQQLVLRLRDAEGLTVTEIADQLDLAASTVRVHLARARQQIRAQWQERPTADRSGDGL